MIGNVRDGAAGAPRSAFGVAPRGIRLGAPLVLASRNPHKLREFRAILATRTVDALPEGIELPPETGQSFEENALSKARAAAAAMSRASMADDSGISVDALGGLPGVRSARYAGPDATDRENLLKLIAAVRYVSDRSASYVCALALVSPCGEENVFVGECRGTLIDVERGTGGFGYDPIFVPDDYSDGRTMAELTPDEKDAISHRGRAARLLAEAIEAGDVLA